MQKIINLMLYSFIVSFLLFSCSKGLGIKNDLSNTAILQSNSVANKTTDGFYYTQINGKLTKTVFTQSEITNFLSSGKASYLGQIKELQVTATRKIKYVKKDNVSILILQTEGEVEVHEISGDISIMAADNGGGPGGNDPLAECRNRCELSIAGCLDENPSKAKGLSRDSWCTLKLILCRLGCDIRYPMRAYTISFPNNFDVKY
ncbi:MAG: hypothetical protein QM802_24835 [Agriterribacter sp.]